MDVLERSLERLKCYNALADVKLWTDGKDVGKLAEEIMKIGGTDNGRNLETHV